MRHLELLVKRARPIIWGFALIDAEDRAHTDIGIDIRRTVERIHDQNIGPSWPAFRNRNRRRLLFGSHDTEVATAPKGLDKALFGVDVQLLLIVARSVGASDFAENLR